MTTTNRPLVVLCGPPGAGKTTVGQLIARTLGVDFIDTDHEVERVAGMPIPQIFREKGEEAFRELEHETVARILNEHGGIVALGGGAVMDTRTQKALLGHLVIFLDVDVTQALPRVGLSGERPLLVGDPVGNFTQLMEQRRAIYEAVAVVHLDTTGLRPDEVGEEILEELVDRGLADTDPTTVRATAHESASATTIEVRGPEGYEVKVGWGLVDDVVKLVGEKSSRALIFYAPAVAEFAEKIRAAVAATGRTAAAHELPDAEATKTIEAMTHMWDIAAEMRLDRADTIIAVGGGATTDAAGFAAASWLRGVRLVNVSTTLLGMVDASVGGKTGINTAAGKNLVGAFYPPAGVVCDLSVLATLPEDDYRAGLAEVIKCGFIADEQILRLVEADGGSGALDRESPVARELIERALAVKARVVGEDLKESGLREILNYGHTFAHAIEAVENFTVRHGEAVAIGMVYAGELAARVQGVSRELVERTRHTLKMVGLPTSYKAGRWDELLEAMRQDKKVRQGVLRFVVLDKPASPSILRAPKPENLRAAYDAITGA